MDRKTDSGKSLKIKSNPLQKMTQDIKSLLNALNETPRLLKELISEINPELYKQELVKRKWSIHEHATHIAVGDRHGFQKRFADFKQLEHPVFKPLSGESFPTHYFMELDLFESIDAFFDLRQSTLTMARALHPNSWNKEATHPEYKKYTPYIMLRHLLMHDHNHLYKIETMGLEIETIK